MDFFGRNQELKRLKSFFYDDLSMAALVYGRRRVGKSELIKQAIKESEYKFIYYECKQTSEANNVESLSLLIAEVFDLPCIQFKNMEAALQFLFQSALNKRIILVLDEYPYLRERVEGLDSIIQGLVDKYRENSQLKLVVCGSYIDTMRSLLLVQNPLYGRVDLTIDLKPMNYLEAACFYPTFSNEDKVRLYSVFGGIPYYNRLINPSQTVEENIIRLIASPGARLENEIGLFLRAEISKISNANIVFETLAKGFTRFKDILSQSHISSGPTLVDVLDRLINMEIVAKTSPINDENNKRKSGYYICDNLALFYYKYVFRYSSQISIMPSEIFYEKYIKEDFNSSHVPKVFESICGQYLIELNKRGLMPQTFEKIGRYYYDDSVNKKNGEFDIVTLDSSGYNFYEAKFRNHGIDRKMIEAEIRQVEATGLQCHHYGFFSKGGFCEDVNNLYKISCFTLDDLFNIEP